MSSDRGSLSSHISLQLPGFLEKISLNQLNIVPEVSPINDKTTLHDLGCFLNINSLTAVPVLRSTVLSHKKLNPGDAEVDKWGQIFWKSSKIPIEMDALTSHFYASYWGVLDCMAIISTLINHKDVDFTSDESLRDVLSRTTCIDAFQHNLNVKVGCLHESASISQVVKSFVSHDYEYLAILDNRFNLSYILSHRTLLKCILDAMTRYNTHKMKNESLLDDCVKSKYKQTHDILHNERQTEREKLQYRRYERRLIEQYGAHRVLVKADSKSYIQRKHDRARMRREQDEIDKCFRAPDPFRNYIFSSIYALFDQYLSIFGFVYDPEQATVFDTVTQVITPSKVPSSTATTSVFISAPLSVYSTTLIPIPGCGADSVSTPERIKYTHPLSKALLKRNISSSILSKPHRLSYKSLFDTFTVQYNNNNDYYTHNIISSSSKLYKTSPYIPRGPFAPSKLISIHNTTPLRDALKIMSQNRLSGLPVVHHLNGTLLGTISQYDISKCFTMATITYYKSQHKSDGTSLELFSLNAGQYLDLVENYNSHYLSNTLNMGQNTKTYPSPVAYIERNGTVGGAIREMFENNIPRCYIVEKRTIINPEYIIAQEEAKKKKEKEAAAITATATFGDDDDDGDGIATTDDLSATATDDDVSTTTTTPTNTVITAVPPIKIIRNPFADDNDTNDTISTTIDNDTNTTTPPPPINTDTTTTTPAENIDTDTTTPPAEKEEIPEIISIIVPISVITYNDVMRILSLDHMTFMRAIDMTHKRRSLNLARGCAHDESDLATPMRSSSSLY